MTKLADAPLVKRGLPWHLDQAFLTPSSAKPIGINVEYEAYSGVRSAGYITSYDSPAVTVDTNGAQKIRATCIGGRESIGIPEELIWGLKNNIPYIAENAKAEFLRRMANFRTRADSRRRNIVASAVLTGKLYVKYQNNGTGLVTTSGTSGAVNVMSAYTPTILNVGDTIPNSGGVTVPDFSVSTTDIPGFFRTIKQAYEQTSNYEATMCQYGKNIPGYMGETNTSMTAYWSRNQILGRTYVDTLEVPPSAFDFQWKPAYRQYFLDEAATTVATKSLIQDDTLVITPAISEDWYEFVEGSSKVPTGIPALMSAASVEELLGQFEYKWGISAYSIMNPQTFQLAGVAQDFTFPVLKNGNLHWIIKVK